MAAIGKCADRLGGSFRESAHGRARRDRGFRSVAETIHDGDENTTSERCDEVEVAGDRLALECLALHGPFEELWSDRLHVIASTSS
jgi:hypothetical protein